MTQTNETMVAVEEYPLLTCECGSVRLNKAGIQMQKRSGMGQRFKCKDCGHVFVVAMEDLIPVVM